MDAKPTSDRQRRSTSHPPAAQVRPPPRSRKSRHRCGFARATRPVARARAVHGDGGGHDSSVAACRCRAPRARARPRPKRRVAHRWRPRRIRRAHGATREHRLDAVAVADDDVHAHGRVLDEQRVNRLPYLAGTPRARRAGSTRGGRSPSRKARPLVPDNRLLPTLLSESSSSLPVPRSPGARGCDARDCSAA